MSLSIQRALVHVRPLCQDHATAFLKPVRNSEAPDYDTSERFSVRQFFELSLML
jgi:hypothetical protein